ncbi:MAG TPA: hypothetical protein VGL07_13535 [Buttiauxella sp.]|jgi:hypothetical protein
MTLHFSSTGWQKAQMNISEFAETIERISYATTASSLVNDLRNAKAQSFSFVQAGIDSDSVSRVLHKAVTDGVNSVACHGDGFTRTQMRETLNLLGLHIPVATRNLNELPLHRQTAPRYDGD